MQQTQKKKKKKKNHVLSFPLFQKFACFKKKIIFVSKEDTNKFFDKKCSDLHLMKTQTNFD